MIEILGIVAVVAIVVLPLSLYYFFSSIMSDASSLSTPHDNVSDCNSEVTASKKPSDEAVKETVALLVELFKMQALLIGGPNGEAYLKSDFSIGLVAGFTDAFLQKTQRKTKLSSAKQHDIMQAVLALVFLDIDTDALRRFYDLQERGDSEFMAGQMKGGQAAFDYLSNPSDSKAQRCWSADFREKCASQKNIAVTASEAADYQQDTDAGGYAATLSQLIMSSLNRFENDTGKLEIPRYIIDDPYFSGFVMGYLAIVIDGMELEQNKSKEDRGVFSIEFYRRFDRDTGTRLIRLLEDLDFAKATAQHPSFTEGRDHGSLWAAHYFGFVSDKSNNMVVKNAKEMSEKDGIDLANCLFLLTFWDRYKR